MYPSYCVITMKVSCDMLNWCYPQDILTWVSKNASTTGEYLPVETCVMGFPDSEVLDLPEEEVCASMIYVSMIHMPALPSFIDGWEIARADHQGNLFFETQRGEEYSNCKYSHVVASVKETWSREELERIWERLRTNNLPYNT